MEFADVWLLKIARNRANLLGILVRLTSFAERYTTRRYARGTRTVADSLQNWSRTVYMGYLSDRPFFQGESVAS